MNGNNVLLRSESIDNATLCGCLLPTKDPKPKNPDDPSEEKEEGEEDEEMEVEKPEEETPQETLKYARGRNSGYHICVRVSRSILLAQTFTDHNKSFMLLWLVNSYPLFNFIIPIDEMTLSA